MRRVGTAFAIGLGLGLSITAVRVVVKARKGLPTAWSAYGSAAGTTNGQPASGPAPPNGYAPPNGQPAPAKAASLTDLLDRLRAALADGAQAMRDTEAELRSTVFGGR